MIQSNSVRLVFTYTLILLVNTNFAREMKLEVKSRVELPGVPSASGIEFFDNAFYIIGDNSAWLYKYTSSLESLAAYRIYEHISNVSDTIPKKEKPDFEASTIAFKNGQNTLFIFGSGSKSPQRDLLIQVDLNNPTNVKSFSLEKFYLKLKAAGVDELNIEGAVYVDQFFYLFNRADNGVIQFGSDEFDRFLQNPESDLNFAINKFKLPVESGLQSGFSGACLIPGTNRIIFTASLEQTDNWIDDGAILGSYVGIFDLKDFGDSYEPEVCPVLENETVVRLKIESVTVKKLSKRKATILMVTDSDGGASELIEATLLLN